MKFTLAARRFSIFDRVRGLMTNPTVHEYDFDRGVIERDLRDALSHDQLFLVYQPIYNLRTGQCEAVEALLRWQHPRSLRLEPLEFLPIAQEIGLICNIEYWVIRRALSQFRSWREAGLHPGLKSIHINVTGSSLQDEQFALRVLQELERQDLEPSTIHLEVNEFDLMVCGESAIEQLNRLRKVGTFVNVDHLGEEELTLANLHEYPIDFIKIDRDFTGFLDTSHNRVAILHLILKKAQSLNIRTIAVGVEDPSQLAVLQSLDCDFAQGNLLCRPLRAEQMNGPLHCPVFP